MINYDMLKVVLGVGNAGGTVVKKMMDTVNNSLDSDYSTGELFSLVSEDKFDYYRDIALVMDLYAKECLRLNRSYFVLDGDDINKTPVKSFFGLRTPTGTRNSYKLLPIYKTLGSYMVLSSMDRDGALMLPSFKLLLEELVGVLYPSDADPRGVYKPTINTLDFHVNKIFTDAKNCLENKDFKDIARRNFPRTKAMNVTSLRSSAFEFSLLSGRMSPEEIFKLLLAIRANNLAVYHALRTSFLRF